jgi:hypothetical protein
LPKCLTPALPPEKPSKTAPELSFDQPVRPKRRQYRRNRGPSLGVDHGPAGGRLDRRLAPGQDGLPANLDLARPNHARLPRAIEAKYYFTARPIEQPGPLWRRNETPSPVGKACDGARLARPIACGTVTNQEALASDRIGRRIV